VTSNGYSALLYGPDFSQIEELPNHTDHHGTPWEVGNTYDRKYYEEYISSVYDAKETVNWGEVSIIDSCPPGSEISMAVRTGDVLVPDNSWSGWYQLSSIPDTIPDSLNSRFIQYKATLSYASPANLPILYEVRVEYKSTSTGIKEFKDSKVYKGDLIVKPSIIKSKVMIEYAIPEEDEIVLRIYDAMGRLVDILDEGYKESGVYKVSWDINNKNLASGVYFVRLKGSKVSLNKRLVFIKERRR